jgi:AcrR family transcriptional regulator
MPAISKREQIIDQALMLFYQYGFNATGVDKIISVAKVSKKTLYNHFRSKNELILATLRKRDELFRNNMMRKTEALATTPRDRLLALFDVMEAWFNEQTFSGCMFINASAEFGDLTDPCHILCAEHKRLICDYIESLAEQAGANEPRELAKQLNLLIEGAIVNAHVEGDMQAGQRAKKIAVLVIKSSMNDCVTTE